MSELQAVLEFQVELFKFYNIDLFQRGYYQVRTSLKTSPKVTAKIDTALTRSHGSGWKSAYIQNGSVGVSKTFKILYRKEDVELYDVFTYKVFMVVDVSKIDQCLADADFQLSVELWFSEDDIKEDTVLQCLSTRIVTVHVKYNRGVHHYVPLQFDYFHLSAVQLTVHASLLALHPSYISLNSGSRQNLSGSTRADPTTLPSEFSRPSSAPLSKASSRRIQQAFDRHQRMCLVLLCVYENLQASFEALISQLPLSKQIELEHVDCCARYEEMVTKCQKYALIDEEDMVQATQSDITTLCGQNMLLWMQYLELVTFNKIITHHLAKEHHRDRVKRFSEGFFFNELRKQDMVMCFNQGIHGHDTITSSVRSSEYFNSIPPLPAECDELDGIASTLPIIFEDIYAEQVVATLESNSTGAVELRRTKTSSSQTSQESRDSVSSRPSRTSRASLYSTVSASGSVYNRKSGRMSVNKPRKPANHQIAVDQQDCELVGYCRFDSSSSQQRYSSGIGTLSEVSPAVGHAPSLSLVGSGVVMQPNVLVSAVSLPTLYNSTGACGYDSTDSLSGSLPLLSTGPNHASSESELAPYWLQQRDKAQLVAQHSSDNSALVTDADPVENCLDTTLVNETESTGASLEDLCTADIKQTGENCPSVSNAVDSCTTADRTRDQVPSDLASDVKFTTGDTDERISTTDQDVIVEVSSASVSEPTTNCDVTCPLAGETSSDIPCNKSEVEQSTTRDEDAETVSMATSDQEKDEVKTESTSSLSNNAPAGERQTQTAATNPIESVAETPKSTPSSDDVSEDELNIVIPSTCESPPLDEKYLSERCTMLEMIRENNSSSLTGCGAVGYDIGERLAGNRHRRDPVRVSDIVVDTVDSRSSPSCGTPANTPVKQSSDKSASSKCLIPVVADEILRFHGAKEKLRKHINYSGHLYSDLPTVVSVWPYFWPADIPHPDDGIHLVVCVHGLDGNSTDLRLVRTYLELALPGGRLDFLMSERNQTDTFADFEVMTDRLVDEILSHIDMFGVRPSRISFIGHSLGNLIIRSAMSKPKMAELLPWLHTFLSLSGPHLGTLFNSSGLVNMGMWLMQKWKKSGSLLQLSLKDHSDPRQTFLYKLSQNTSLEFFRNILLVGSQQDRYVPYHSSRIELCKAAVKDSSGLGAVYSEMVNNILQPIIYKSDINFVRYDVYHALPSSTTNNLIGRAAHIAVLDSELFIEKFVSVAVLKYFI